MKHDLKPFITLLIIGCCTSGCGADRWTGSVDAVFRYRPSETSTVVHEIRPGSAAEAAGLAPGDRLLAVDGTDIQKADFEIVRAALRGPVGTNALLKVQRGESILEITIERRPIAADRQ
jgi:carboxyl-terminal processing protease